jgi:hypothetical protein
MKISTLARLNATPVLATAIQMARPDCAQPTRLLLTGPTTILNVIQCSWTTFKHAYADLSVELATKDTLAMVEKGRIDILNRLLQRTAEAGCFTETRNLHLISNIMNNIARTHQETPLKLALNDTSAKSTVGNIATEQARQAYWWRNEDTVGFDTIDQLARRILKELPYTHSLKGASVQTIDTGFMPITYATSNKSALREWIRKTESEQQATTEAVEPVALASRRSVYQPQMENTNQPTVQSNRPVRRSADGRTEMVTQANEFDQMPNRDRHNNDLIGWLMDRIRVLEQRETTLQRRQKSPPAARSSGQTWPDVDTPASTSSSSIHRPMPTTRPNGRKHHPQAYTEYSYEHDECDPYDQFED